MTLIQLQSLCLVAEEGSFSRAAERMFVTQPALSMQMKSLEREIGQTLLDRTGRRVSLTEAGRALAEGAKDAMARLDDAVQEVSRVGGLEHGTLSIGSSDTIGEFYLLPILSAFMSRYPGISVTVHNRPTSQIEQLVMDNVAEVGLVTLPASTPQLVSRTIFDYRDLALCTPEHTLAARSSVNLQRLVRSRLLLLPSGTRSRTLLERDLSRAGAAAVTVMELGSVHLQKSFAKIGLGVAIVPDYAVRAETAAGEIRGIPVVDLSPRRIGVIHRDRRPISPAARTFLTMLERHNERGDRRS